MFAEVCFKSEIGGNSSGSFEIDDLIDIGHNAGANQSFDNINRTDLEQVR